MDGPPPADPRVLDDAAPAAPSPTPTATAPAPTPAMTAAARSHPLLGKPKATPAPAPAPAPVDLFASDDPPLAPPLATAATSPPASTPAPAAAPSAGLFDLDFRTPTPTAAPKTAKNDIMSLFSAAPAPSVPNPYASWGGGGTSAATPQQQYPQHQAPIAGFSAMNMDSMGAGVWGQQQHQAPAPTQTRGFDSHDVWASPAPAQTPSAPIPDPAKQDPFANIWG